MPPRKRRRGAAAASSSSGGAADDGASVAANGAAAEAAGAGGPPSDDGSSSSDEDGGGGIPLTGLIASDEEDEEDDDSEDEAGGSGGSQAGKKRKGDKAKAKEKKSSKKKKGAESHSIDITFEFKDPNPEFYHSVRSMLRGFLPQSPVDQSALADSIAGTTEIGTMVVQEEMTDLFGLMTMVNLGMHRDLAFVQQIRAYLIDKCPSGKAARLKTLLENRESACAILVNERMVNLPPQLVPQMHGSLCQDITWARENAEDEADELEQAFDYVVVVAPCSTAKGDDEVAASQEVAEAGLPSGTFFDKFDDEYACQGPELSFAFAAAEKQYMVSVLKYKVYASNVEKMANLF